MFQSFNQGSSTTDTSSVMLLVQPNQAEIAEGTSQQFRATLYLSNGTQLDVTPLVQWESSDTSVASVNDAGLAQGLSRGPATIRASGQNLSSSATLTVSAARLTRLELEPVGVSTPAGLTQQFMAFGIFSNGLRENLSSQVRWSVLDTSLGSIDAGGLATGVKTGATLVRADFGGQFVETAWTISNANLTRLRVTPADALTAPGSSRRYQAFGDFSDGSSRDVTGEVSWEAGDASVTFSNPLVASEARVAGDAAAGTNSSIRASLSGVEGAAQLRLGQFAYVAYSAFTESGGVGAFEVSNQGQLTRMNLVNNRQVCNWVAVEPTGRFAYVANQLGDNVSSYRIQNDGSLQANGPDVRAGNSAFFDVVHPNGKFLYVANASDRSVSSFTIGEDGRLTSLEPSVACGAGPRSIALDPAGHFLYVANFDDHTISVYSVSEEGRLTALQTIPTPFQPWTVAVHPSGQFLFVTLRRDHSIGRYRVGTDGKLTALGTTAMPQGESSLPTSLVLHRNGGFAYVNSVNGGYVNVFAIDGDGGLTYSSQVSGLRSTDSMALDASSRFLLVPDRADVRLYSYSTNPGGALSLLSQVLGLGNSSVSVTTTP